MPEEREEDYVLRLIMSRESREYSDSLFQALFSATTSYPNGSTRLQKMKKKSSDYVVFQNGGIHNAYQLIGYKKRYS